MVASLKIPDDEMAFLREAAELNSRSLAGQAAHWIRLGRAVENNPHMTVSRVQRALRGEVAVSELTETEQEGYLDGLGAFLRKPSAVEDAIFDEIRRDWEGVTIDQDDKAVMPR